MTLSEFELIEKFFSGSASQCTDVVTGVGDDGAVVRVPSGQDRVSASATITANSPNINTENPQTLGHRVLSTALNRLAARGAEPAWMTLALTLPEANESWLEAFSQGLLALAERFRVALIGGDTTKGPLTVTVTVDGLVPTGTALTGASAEPHDIVCVSGALGTAGTALVATTSPHLLTDQERRAALQRLEYPEPRVLVGAVLGGIATAVSDLSQGLSRGVEVLLAKNTGATIELGRLPIAQCLRQQMALTGSWRQVLSLVGDHELMFSLPLGEKTTLESRFSELDIAISTVGRIDDQPGVRLLDEDPGA